MAQASYIYVPFDGSRESVVTDLSKINIIDDHKQQTELYDRLADANIVDVRAWRADKGILFWGSKEDAYKISNLVSSFSMASGNDNIPECRRDFRAAAMGSAPVRPAAKPSITGRMLALA